MSDNIYTKIYEVIGKYKDPLTNQYLDHTNSNINLVIKNGNVNLSISIDPNQSEKYLILQKKLKEELQKIDNLQSVNIILTAEKKTY